MTSPSDPGAVLAAALVALQADLPDITKSEIAEVEMKNGGTYTYTYADLAGITKQIRPVMAKHGFAFTAFPTLVDGKMVLAYSLIHSSGERLSGDYPLSGSGSPQSMGSSITYARRYCLCAVIGLAPEDDDDAAAAQAQAAAGKGTAQRQQRGQAASKPTGGRGETAQRADRPQPSLPGEDLINQPQMAKLQALFGEQGYATPEDKRAFLEEVVGHPLASTKALTKAEAARAIDRLEKREDPAADGEPSGGES